MDEISKQEITDYLTEKGLKGKEIDEVIEMIEDMSKSEADVKYEQAITARYAELMKGLNEIISNEGLKKIIESLIHLKSESITATKTLDNQDLTDSRKYLYKRYWQDIVTIIIILAAIVGLVALCGLDKQAVGTLMGAIIGYALGRFRNKASEN